MSSGPTFGDGIAVTDSLPPVDGLMYFPNDFSSYTLFYLWQDPVYNLHLASSICPESNPSCVEKINIFYISPSPDFAEHVFRITPIGNKYRIDLDGINRYFSTDTGRIAKYVWLGHPMITLTNGTWSSFLVSEIYTTDYFVPSPSPSPSPPLTPYPTTSPSPSPSLSPIPVPTLDPIVLVPGMGSSWDYQAILTGQKGDNWTVPNFINVYSDLVNSLVANGYRLNENLFIFAYDWRQKVVQSGRDLNSYLSRLVYEGKISHDDKVSLVGHSMGGLVIRSFLHLDTRSQQIGAVIMAGSPHFGAIDSYGIWEGATMWNSSWWQKAGVELLTTLNRLPGETRVETLRRMVPSVEDILPTFDYLFRSNQVVGWQTMKQYNKYLSNLNALPEQPLSVLFGSGQSTKNGINVSDRGILDKLLGEWEDGKPIAQNPFKLSSVGDGTVLSYSARGSYVNTFGFTTNHSGVIGFGNVSVIEKIQQLLGVSTVLTPTISLPLQNEDVFMVALQSPGRLRICSLGKCDEIPAAYAAGLL